MKKILIPLVIVMIVSVVGLAGFMLYSILAGSNAHESLTASYLQADDDYGYENYAQPVFLEIVHHDDGIVRISQGTLITFQYYRPDSSEFENSEEHAPPALIGLTQSELALMFADWRIVSFTPYHVRLQQNPLLSQQQFIISVHDGFIAVFYDNGEGMGLKELTARPIAALPEGEQIRLIEGIRVTGNEELIRALEDFDS